MLGWHSGRESAEAERYILPSLPNTLIPLPKGIGKRCLKQSCKDCRALQVAAFFFAVPRGHNLIWSGENVLRFSSFRS